MKPDISKFPRLTKAGLVLMLLALLAGGGWFYHVQEDAMLQKVKVDLSAIARLKADQIAGWRRERLNVGAELMERPFVTERVTQWMEDPQAGLREALLGGLRVLQRNDDYADVQLVDPDGQIRLALSGASGAGHPGALPALAAALHDRRPVFVDLHTDAAGATPHTSVVVPLFAGTGQARRPLGAVILISNASRFLYPLIQSWPMPSKTAETLLVRRDGDHVVFLTDLRHQPDAALKLRIPLSRTEVTAVMAVLGREGFVQGRDYRGVEVVSFLLPIPDSPWFMVAKVDAAEVFAEWRFESVLMFLLLLGLTAFIGVAGLVLRQREKKVHYRALYCSEAALRANVERHSITLKAIGDAVIATDARGLVELLNPVAEALTGWTEGEARGRPLEEVFCIVNEETREKVENPVAKVLREGVVVGLANHTQLIARDGAQRPIADSVAPIRDEKDEIIGVVLVFRDQTGERAAREALRESEERYRTILESIEESYFEVDLIGNFTFCNDSLSKSLGYSNDELMGMNNRAYMSPESGKKIYNLFNQIYKTGNPIRKVTYEIMRKDGSRGFHELHASLMKNQAGQPIGFRGIGHDITEFKKAEDALRESEKRFRLTFQTSPDPINLNRIEDGIYIDINEAFTKVMGYTREEVIGNPSLPVKIWKNPEDRKRLVDGLTKTGYVENMEAQFVGKDGKIRYGLISARVARISGENLMISITRDITERKRAEEERDELQAQLSQAQKMESVGRLAGGVAHDLNNSLQPILGYADLALMELDKSEPLYCDIEEIRKAAIRSTNIVRQLLAFARKQSIAPVVLDLNDTMEGMLKMLRRLISEDIELAWMPGAGLWPVRMDPSQVDQILANLVVNARDAVAGVGKVRIETRNAELDGDYCRSHAGAVAGRYVLLAVSDSGSGMDKGVLGQLFEPFFTTKEVGKGTGLGLATVYGIVRQNNGWIDVESEPGKGSTFRIYLPGYEGEKDETQGPSPSAAHLTGTGTVLLVEDQKAVLDLGRRLLTRLGYRVLTAGTPGEAMRLAEEREGEIRLLMTDVIMPEMNGRDLADHLRKTRPGLKCLFMSGYTADVIAHHGVLEQGVQFIQKPFTMNDLAVKVREVLDALGDQKTWGG